MTGGPLSARNAVRAMARIAATPVRIEDRATELVALLRRVVPVQGAWLALLDDERRGYVELTSAGYDDRIRDYFGTTELLDQIDHCGLSRSPVPQRARDSPVPLDELPVWPEHYWPAGFCEGVALGLFAPDRRHLGVLLLSTDDKEHPTDGERDLVATLAPAIGAAVDPLRSVAVLARIVRHAVSGVVLTRGGAALSLPGLPGHALLTPGSALLGLVARQHRVGTGCGSFLWPARPGTPDGDEWDARGDLFRVVVLDCPPQPPHLAAVVVLSSPPDGWPALTRRELTVLGLLLEGWPDQRIGVALDLPAGAVADVAARITARLGAPDRDTAVLRAARRGWFIPDPRATRPS